MDLSKIINWDAINLNKVDLSKIDSQRVKNYIKDDPKTAGKD